MKIKVNANSTDMFFDSCKQPVMVILTDDDKVNIANMAEDCDKYCVYPDNIDPDVISEWMHNDNINESLPKSTQERVHRRTREKKIEPPDKNNDVTPHRPADNDPTKTSRGRASVKKQAEDNKKHPEKFAEDATDFIINAMELDESEIANLASSLPDPIYESNIIGKLIEEYDIDKLEIIDEIIHNCWKSRPIERYVGIALRSNVKQELEQFNRACQVIDEIKQWDTDNNRICWIERIIKHSGPSVALPSSYCVYKVVADYTTPSNVFAEAKIKEDRKIILPNARANIIQIINGDCYDTR